MLKQRPSPDKASPRDEAKDDSARSRPSVKEQVAAIESRGGDEPATGVNGEQSATGAGGEQAQSATSAGGEEQTQSATSAGGEEQTQSGTGAGGEGQTTGAGDEEEPALSARVPPPPVVILEGHTATTEGKAYMGTYTLNSQLVHGAPLYIKVRDGV